MKIAVIGSGIAGLSSAWILSGEHEVTLYEANDYIGGHANTRDADFGGKTVSADTGFMVFNEETYPNMMRMFAYLGIERVETNMSFGITMDGGAFEFSSDNVFVQTANLFRPAYWSMLGDIVQFNKNAYRVAFAHNEEFALKDLLAELKLGEAFQNTYLLPMAGAIWSTEKTNILEYPARQFIAFCENHGLLNPKTLNPFKASEGRLQWYTVKGGSRTYVQNILARMQAEVLLEAPVTKVARADGRVVIEDGRGGKREFDHVVCASHPEQTLDFLGDATDEEQQLLGTFAYTKNETFMHTNDSVMLKRTQNWPSWTYREDGDREVELSYYMNRLQSIDPAYPVFVTLNPIESVPEDDIFYSIIYEHPKFSVGTAKAQEEVAKIQGKQNTSFVGAWLGHGFHEDGLRSALGVTALLGCTPPWELNE